MERAQTLQVFLTLAQQSLELLDALDEGEAAVFIQYAIDLIAKTPLANNKSEIRISDYHDGADLQIFPIAKTR